MGVRFDRVTKSAVTALVALMVAGTLSAPAWAHGGPGGGSNGGPNSNQQQVVIQLVNSNITVGGNLNIDVINVPGNANHLRLYFFQNNLDQNQYVSCDVNNNSQCNVQLPNYVNQGNWNVEAAAFDDQGNHIGSNSPPFSFQCHPQPPPGQLPEVPYAAFLPACRSCGAAVREWPEPAEAGRRGHAPAVPAFAPHTGLSRARIRTAGPPPARRHGAAGEQRGEPSWR
jgi:hypothetical protein